MSDRILHLGEGARLFTAPPGTHPVCLRYQEVDDTVPGGLRFSCECGGEGCPHRPGRRWHEIGTAARAELYSWGPVHHAPWPTFDADAAREAFERIGRGFQAMTVSFRLAMGEFSRLYPVLFGPDAPRSPYVSRIRSDYRRRSRARVRRRRS